MRFFDNDFFDNELFYFYNEFDELDEFLILRNKKNRIVSVQSVFIKQTNTDDSNSSDIDVRQRI